MIKKIPLLANLSVDLSRNIQRKDLKAFLCLGETLQLKHDDQS